MPPGIFITFEGSEGCGKTTQFERLARRLEAADAGRPVARFREPGGTALGEEIRRLLKWTAPAWSILPEAELLLFAASRAQLVRAAIEPALARGEIVLCDRFLDSTTVYQGVARRLAAADVAAINRFAAGGRQPDLTFLLDLPANAARARVLARGGPSGEPADRMDQELPPFYEQVRAGYLALAEACPDRIIVIDAALPIDEIERLIWDQLTRRFHGFCSPGRP
jgi:dTMP kinase